MTTEILLVRHGETEWNRNGRYQGATDVPLSDIGIAQAQLVAERFSGESFDVVIASPLSRALATAQAIADASDMEVAVTYPAMAERNYGDAEGHTLAERNSQWPDGIWPNLETVEALWERADSWLHEVYATFVEQRVVAVSHGGFINAVLHNISNGEVGTGKTRLLNVSITRISSSDGQTWSIDGLNDVNHLIDEDGNVQALNPAAVDAAGLAPSRTG